MTTRPAQDPAPPSGEPSEPLRRLIALVAAMVEDPGAAPAHRAAAESLRAALKDATVSLVRAEDGSLREGPAGEAPAGEAPAVEAPLLASRFTRYGIEQLGLTKGAALADLLDLGRALAAEPSGSDPAAAFAARTAVLDRRTIPRRLRAPTEASPTEPIAAVPSTEPPRRSRDRRPTPRPSGGQAAVRGTTPIGTEPIREGPSADLDRPERPLDVPTIAHGELAAAVEALRAAQDDQALGPALDGLVLQVGLAFKQGRFDDLLDGFAALVAIESTAVAAEPTDQRRQLFNHAIARLREPVVVRQLAVLRHRGVGEAERAVRAQGVLQRLGTHGVEALVDEFFSAPSQEARAACLEALGALRRTPDVLQLMARELGDEAARQAAVLLGEVRSERAEELLVELLHHEVVRVRRAAVGAIGRYPGDRATGELALALDDESPQVRLRAVAALAERRPAHLPTLLSRILEQEPSTEVLFSAIGALGALGSVEAVQVLIRVAQGEGAHPQRRTPAVRILACTALVGIRTPVAMAAVQGLRDDRDAEVREASMRLVAQASRRSTAVGIPAVPGPGG